MREMKDSGVEWIEKIPKEWDAIRVKQLFSFGKGLPITKENLIDKGVAVISYGQIHSKMNNGIHIKDELIRYVSEDYIESNPNSLVKQGDFIFADTSEDTEGCGNCVYVDKMVTLFAGYHTIIFFSKSKCDNRFLGYLFKTDAWRSQIRAQVTGVKLFSISKKILSSTSVIMPESITVQNRIADYLDSKCSQIDAIIEKQQAVIEKLNEYKLSLITECVTKGLNSNVEMKDSGVEWIGDIPKHWNMVYAKQLFAQRKDRAYEEDEQLTSSQKYGIISQKEFMEIEGRQVMQVLKGEEILKHVEKGDFVISMRSFQGGLEYSEVSGKISSAYVMLIPNEAKVYERYYKWLFKSKRYISALQGTSNLIRDGQALRYSNFVQVHLPNFDMDEQKQIADYLDNVCPKLDMEVEKREKLLEKMYEYKKSLIYEVVTGKKEV